MLDNPRDPEFNLLAAAVEVIKPQFVRHTSIWTGSPFEWVVTLPPASKGRLGKQLVRQYFALKDLSIDTSPDPEADMLINGHRIEVKFSMLWENGVYTFQQIRDQNYEYAICLGISPFLAHCWVASKALLKENVIGILGQHTGSSGQDTAWFTFLPSEPPEWLRPFGGSLGQAFTVLKNLRKIT